MSREVRRVLKPGGAPSFRAWSEFCRRPVRQVAHSARAPDISPYERPLTDDELTRRDGIHELVGPAVACPTCKSAGAAGGQNYWQGYTLSIGVWPAHRGWHTRRSVITLTR